MPTLPSLLTIGTLAAKDPIMNDHHYLKKYSANIYLPSHNLTKVEDHSRPAQ